MAARNSTGASRANGTSADLDAATIHFDYLRGDLNVARKSVQAAQAVVEMVDALQKEGALVEGVDYFAVLRVILKDANGMITAAGVEWDEVECALGPLDYDEAARARATEAANHA